MNISTAITTLITTHEDLEDVAVAIMDYLDDAEDVPTNAALDVIVEAGDHDMCEIAEILHKHNARLSVAFCDAAELCPACFCDLDVCADDDTCPGA